MKTTSFAAAALLAAGIDAVRVVSTTYPPSTTTPDTRRVCKLCRLPFATVDSLQACGQEIAFNMVSASFIKSKPCENIWLARRILHSAPLFRASILHLPAPLSYSVHGGPPTNRLSHLEQRYKLQRHHRAEWPSGFLSSVLPFAMDGPQRPRLGRGLRQGKGLRFSFDSS